MKSAGETNFGTFFVFFSLVKKIFLGKKSTVLYSSYSPGGGMTMGNVRIVPDALFFYNLYDIVIGSFWANLRPAKHFSAHFSRTQPAESVPQPSAAEPKSVELRPADPSPAQQSQPSLSYLSQF